jgi:hypothetical protein
MFLNHLFGSILLLIILCGTTSSGFAQTTIVPITPPTFPSFDRTITGTISLDRGVADQDYTVEIVLTRRGFRFSGPPSFIVTNPIEDTYRTTARIAKGRSSARYRISNISTIGFNRFALEMVCGECGPVITRQFFTPNGNEFSFSNRVILDGEEIPSRLNLNLSTGFSVFGTVRIKDDEPAPRDLNLRVVISPTNDRSVFIQSGVFIIPSGESSVNYQAGGLRPDIGGQLEIALICENCDDIAPELTRLGRLLPLSQDNFGVDFILKKSIGLSAIVDLLLGD